MVDEGKEGETPIWTLHMKGASSAKGSENVVILEREGEIVTKLSMKFNFSIFNNQAKYEALIIGLQLAVDIKVIRLTICSDFYIVTS